MEAKSESLEDIVSQDPDVHSGDLVFAGTRVPARFLPECLKAGQTLEEFLADYPTVSLGTMRGGQLESWSLLLSGGEVFGRALASGGLPAGGATT